MWLIVNLKSHAWGRQFGISFFLFELPVCNNPRNFSPMLVVILDIGFSAAKLFKTFVVNIVPVQMATEGALLP